MSKIPVLKPREVVRVLERLGFQAIRQKGSHLFMRHPDGRSTVAMFSKKRRKTAMKRIKLTRQEREIEGALIKGEYVNVDKLDLAQVAQAVAHRKKDTQN